jgi:hypothetical protein
MVDESKAKAVVEEVKRFEGTWRYESAVGEGQRVPDEVFMDARLISREINSR